MFKSKFQALVVRRGYKRAIIAIGHKMLRTLFFMLNALGTTQRSSLDQGADPVRLYHASQRLILHEGFFA